MIRLLVILGTCFSLSVQAQDFLSWKYADRYFTVSAGTGSATYFGDISTKIQTTPRVLNLALEARLLTHVSARIEASKYTLKARDSWAKEGSFEQQRNHAFNSNNYEGNLQVIYYLRPYRGDYYSRWQWDSYIGTGIGITTYNPHRGLNGEKYFLRDLETEANKKSYGNMAISIPVTAGVKFKVNDFTNLNFELGYRITTTDFLDDVSGIYGEPTGDNLVLDDLSNPKDLIPTTNEDAYSQLQPGVARGNSSSFDSYLFVLLKVEFYLPSGSGDKKGGSN